MNTEQAKKREYYDGLVGGPGKFEGEPPWTLYFYDMYMNGDGEYVDEHIQRFNILAEDIAIFPELNGSTNLTLYFDDNGFVHSDYRTYR